jgi:hypothetical protein
LDQFIELWTSLQQVNLLPGQQDRITWILTTDGKYSTKSAYEVQFIGRIKQPSLTRAEGKVQSFLWLLLQNRKWTAERLRARRLPHDDCCCLCDQEFETARHLVLQCPFAREVWTQFQGSDSFVARTAAQSLTVCGFFFEIGEPQPLHQRDAYGLLVLFFAGSSTWPPCATRDLYNLTVCGWWNKIRRGRITNQRKKDIALSMYILWHLWKERGRRIFQNEFLPAPALASLIRADFELVALAKGVSPEM